MILRIKHFEIKSARGGFTIHNTHYDFDDAHTHIRDLGQCKTIVDNILKKKRPETHDQYLLESYIRICECAKYRKMIMELKVSRARKKPNYININKGVRT